MVRSAVAALAVLILPTFAQAQVLTTDSGTHTVVRDDTLWDLAQYYYSDPFEWRRIWNANRDVVEDPNWIYPAEQLVIPGRTGDGMNDMSADASSDVNQTEPTSVDMVPFGLRATGGSSSTGRTVFYDSGNDNLDRVGAASAYDYAAVSQDAAWSAPWLIGLEGQPANLGYVEGHAETTTRSESMRSYQPIRVRIASPEVARVGTLLQLFRVERSIDFVGQVVIPTGVAEVRAVADSVTAIAVIFKEYDQILPGDYVGALPNYEPIPGRYAEAVGGGSEAMVMGFAGGQVITEIGHIAFIDLGSDDGIAIGDEFVLYGEAIPTEESGVLQVVGVQETTAAARVMAMSDNVFHQGIVVRLSKKMP